MTTRWSPEVRVLRSPAAAFRELTKEQGGGAWTLVRRPVLLAFVCGCTVSLQASGRLSARLIVDGAISFAFVPAFEMAALAAVYWRSPQRLSFARAVDLSFAATAPWLLWLMAFAVLRCLQSPRQAAAPEDVLLWTLEVSLVPIAAWAACIDLQFFREVLPRPDGHAARDLMLQRAIGWSCTVVWFFGYAIWPEIVRRWPRSDRRTFTGSGRLVQPDRWCRRPGRRPGVRACVM